MSTPPADLVLPRHSWLRARPFVVAGGIAIVIGGLLAAIAATTGSEVGAWAAAYLVLVAGAAQIVLVAGRVAFSRRADRSSLIPDLVGWNLGSLAVLFGTWGSSFVTVLLGSVLLVAVLMECLVRVRSVERRALLFGYRVLLVLLMASVVIGCVLAS